MGCICSKDSAGSDSGAENDKEKQNQIINSSVPVVAPSSREEVMIGLVNTKNEVSVNSKPNEALQVNGSLKGGNASNGSIRGGNDAGGSVRGGNASNGSVRAGNAEGSGKTRIVERPKDSYYKRSTTDMGPNGSKQTMSRIVSMPHGAKGEQVTAGWPSWLSSVAGEAIQGWVPRSAESFERLNKVSPIPPSYYFHLFKPFQLPTTCLVCSIL